MFKQYKVSSKKKNILLNIINSIIKLFFLLPNLKKKTFNHKKVKKILLMRLDNIGDMVMTTSFITNLQSNFPNAKITILCRPNQSIILKNLSSNIIIKQYDAPWFGGKDSYIKLIKLLIKNYKKYDFGIELHGEIISNLIIRLLSNFCIGFGIRGGENLLNYSYTYDWNSKKNIVDIQFNLLKHLNLKINSTKLVLPTKEKIKFFNNNKKTILIHPGVSTKSRSWSNENWATLIKKLNKNYNIILTDNNNTNLKYFENLKLNNFKILTGNITYLIQIINSSDLIIGLESLSAHIAAALNKNQIAIYSNSTPVNLMYPYNKKAIIIRDTSTNNKINYGIQNITPQDIIKKIKF